MKNKVIKKKLTPIVFPRMVKYVTQAEFDKFLIRFKSFEDKVLKIKVN